MGKTARSIFRLSSVILVVKMIPQILFSLLSITLAVSAAHLSDGIIPGGFEPLNPEESKVTAVGVTAAGLLSDSRNALFLLKLVQVKSAKVKVVNGLLYRIKLVVGSTSCMREEEEEDYEAALTRCSKTNDDEVWGSTQTCNIDVLLSPRRKKEKRRRRKEERRRSNRRKETEERKERRKEENRKWRWKRSWRAAVMTILVTSIDPRFQTGASCSALLSSIGIQIR